MSDNDKSKAGRGVRRIPQESMLYTRVVPIALAAMVVLMVVIIVIALGVLLGLIRWGG